MKRERAHKNENSRSESTQMVIGEEQRNKLAIGMSLQGWVGC